MEDKKINFKESEANTIKLDVQPCDFNDLDRGWSWVIMFASFATFCIVGGYTYGVGIIHVAFMKKYEEDVTLTSWAGTLMVAICSMAGPFSTAVTDTFSCRTAVILSGLLYTTGFLGTAFAPNIQAAIFTCGILAGLGGGICYTANAVVVGMNFKRRRNLALGFSISGIAAGLFVFAPLMQLALNFYGPTGFFITLATISANIVTFGAMYFPSELEMYTQKMRKLEAKSGGARVTSKNSLKAYTKRLLIKPVVCLCMSIFAYGAGIYVIFLYLPTYIESKGFTGLQASFFLSLNGIISVIARFITGVFANFKCIDELWLFSGSMFVVSFATFLYCFISNTFVGQIVFFALFGLSFGSCFILMPSVGIRFVGIHFISAAIGIQLFFCGIGSIAGPVCAGMIVDSGGDYKECFLFAAASILVAAISSASTIVCSSKTSSNSSTDQRGNTETGELLTVNERETTF